MEDMTAIETKELKGVNLKNIVAIIIATVGICTTTIVSYSKLESKIDKLELQKQGDERYNELRLRTIEINLSSMELRIKEIESKLEK